MEEYVFDQELSDMLIAQDLNDRGLHIIRTYRKGENKVVLAVPKEWRHEASSVLALGDLPSSVSSVAEP